MSETIDFFEYQRVAEEQKKFLAIEQAHELTLEMEKEATKYMKLAQLAFEDELSILKDTLRGRYLHLTYAVHGASKWLKMLNSGEKIDHRKRYEEKEQFEYLTHRISDMLGYHIDIQEIRYFGWGEIAFEIVFKIQDDAFGHLYELTIPDTEKLDREHLLYLDYGKMRLSYASSSCSWDSICSSYHEKDLKNKLKEWLTPTPV